MAQSLRTCPACKHSWQTEAGDASLRCPKCGVENRMADAATPPPSQAPAAVYKPPVKKVAARPMTVPKKSHGVRNTVAIVLGLGGGLFVLHLLGVNLIPHWKFEPADPAVAKKEQKAAEKKLEEPKKEDPKPVVPVTKPPEEPVKEPPPKAAPLEPDPDFSKETAFDVLKIESGGVIIVKGATRNITVRMIGVTLAKSSDPPIHGTRDAGETQAYLQRELKGQKVYLYYGVLDSPRIRAERDAYGSDLAWVFRAKDKMFVNLELVREGYGRVNADHAKEFLELLEYWQERR